MISFLTEFPFPLKVGILQNMDYGLDYVIITHNFFYNEKKAAQDATKFNV